MNTSNMLYHYCTLEKAVELILPEYKLLVNDIIKTNDPRENKIFPITFKYSKLVDSLNDKNDINSKKIEVSNELKKGCKILFFYVNNNILGYEISPMWAHYGSKHKGVCLEIDKEKFIRENLCESKNTIEINPAYLRKINYNDYIGAISVDYDMVKSTASKKYIEQLRNENIEKLYFTKLSDWSYESEYRLLHISKNTENEYCSIRDSLNSIYLGVDFFLPFAETIKKICPNIQMHLLIYVEGRMHPQSYR